MSWTPILKASFARSLFVIHGTMTVWFTAETLSVPQYYFLLPVLILPLEMIVTTKFTDSADWKWFCLSVCLYLASVVPGLWLLHLNQYEIKARHREEIAVGGCRGSDVTTNHSSSRSGEIAVPLVLGDESILALEQFLLALLIVGRWLLPKGSLTRDQLSQLLLVYIGTAVDILEFSTESKNVDAVACSRELTMILFLWTVSLLRYTVVIHSIPLICKGCLPSWCDVEMLSTWLTILMQDGPFLIMRIYLLVDGGAVNQMMLVFHPQKRVDGCTSSVPHRGRSL